MGKGMGCRLSQYVVKGYELPETSKIFKSHIPIISDVEDRFSPLTF